MRPVWTLTAVLISSAAWAQDGGLDGHGFTLSAWDGDPRGLHGVVRAGAFEQGDGFAGAALELARRTMVVQLREGDGWGEPVPVLDNLLTLDLGVGLAVHDRLRFDVAMPVYLTASDDTGSRGGSLGDTRLRGLVALVRPGPSSGYGLGLVASLDLPTGAVGRWLGQSGWGGGVELAQTVELGRWTLTGDVGLELRPRLEQDNLTGADRLVFGLGVGALVTERDGLSAEARLAAPLSSNALAWTETPSEWMLTYKRRQGSGAYLSAGAGTALTRGVGAAAWRLVVGGGFGLRADHDDRTPVSLDVPEQDAARGVEVPR